MRFESSFLTNTFVLRFISPSIYAFNNAFTLKFPLLLLFFFPVFLILVMLFDSYLTIDYVLFFYTDEADFDDFIVVLYMVLFTFLMLADYDLDNINNEMHVDFFETTVHSSSFLNDLNNSYAYYNMDSGSSNFKFQETVYFDKASFMKLFFISSNSLNYFSNFMLSNVTGFKEKFLFLSKSSVNRYIMDDAYALSLNTDDKFFFLTGMMADEINLMDSDAKYIYNIYLTLFDLDLNRAALIINYVFLYLTKICMSFNEFLVNNEFRSLDSNFNYSMRLRITQTFKSNFNLSDMSIQNVFLTRLSAIGPNSEEEDIMYDNWFSERGE